MEYIISLRTVDIAYDVASDLLDAIMVQQHPLIRSTQIREAAYQRKNVEVNQNGKICE